MAVKDPAVSSETVKTAEPVQPSTRVIVAEALYSGGNGPKIAVMAFDGKIGAKFAEIFSKALGSDLKVYSPERLAAKKYDVALITRISARKIAVEIDVDYLVTGKVSEKSETLSIISIFLRDGKTGDIKMTENYNLRSDESLGSSAENAARKIADRVKQ